MMRFRDKAVLVTGATGGIGRATVDSFVAEGARVLASGRSEARLEAIRIEHGDRVRTVAADMKRLDEVRSLVRQAVDKLGRLDVLVNCAGVAIEEPLLEVTDSAWNETLAVNLTAALFASQEAVRHMLKTGGGAIVNVSSIDAFLAEAGYIHYSVSKAGLSMVTKGLAQELGHLGIRCNAVAPGITWTAMWEQVMTTVEDADATYEMLVRRIPMRRPAKPHEQADVILYLASEEASFINGTTVVADGGQMCGYWDAPEDEPPVLQGPPRLED